MSREDVILGNGEDILCAKCDIPLVVGYVTLGYLGHAFPVELYKCPECRLVYIPPDLARGKMLHVEKALEDK